MSEMVQRIAAAAPLKGRTQIQFIPGSHTKTSAPRRRVRARDRERTVRHSAHIEGAVAEFGRRIRLRKREGCAIRAAIATYDASFGGSYSGGSSADVSLGRFGRNSL